jgi:LysM repeat protein
MNFTCTRGLLLLALASLLLGAAACTQPKPNVPTVTLVPLNQTPLAPASNNTPSVVGTSPPGATVAPATNETPVSTEPTNLPTPTLPFATLAPPPASGQETPVPSTSGGGGGGACTNPYIVQRGEHLFQIARKCGVAYSALLAANPGLALNPNLVLPGTALNLPGAGAPPPPGGVSGGHTYVVRPGDTLFSIAVRNGTTVFALMQANGIQNPNFIFVGQVLRIP